MAKILFISPHTDDVEIACGGSIHLLGRTHTVRVISLCHKFKQDLSSEFCKAMDVLGISNYKIYGFDVRGFYKYPNDILETLRSENQGFSPEIVVIPNSNDTHQDHQIIYNESLRAFKSNQTILGFDQPWNNQQTSNINYFLNINEVNLAVKIEAINCYKSQKNKSYTDPIFIRSWSIFRGTQVNLKLAEGFEFIRGCRYNV